MDVNSQWRIDGRLPRVDRLWPPSSIRVVDWNIDRGLQLNAIVEFLAGYKSRFSHLAGVST